MHTMGPPPAKSPEKPPLITPSASPPPARLPSRMSDGASPTKKQRFNSTPRRTPSDVSSSASRAVLPEDVQKERKASKMRLFDVWSSLAERYTVPVEEDDIINIQTGEITRDNGYLRKSKKLDFGAIALGDVAAEDYDSPEEEEDEYDIDELDAFADDVSEISYHDADGQPDEELVERVMPPPMVLTAADAEDLREFMNAERLRRELCGSDLDDEEVEGYSTPEQEEGGTDISDKRAEASNSPNRVISEEYEEVENNEEDVTTREEEELVDETAVGDLERPPMDPVSEDELDNWNIDDANVVYPVVKEEQRSDHGHSDTDSEVEIIEDSGVNFSFQNSTAKAQEQIYTLETPTALRFRPQVHKPLHQLYTPPQSSSSSRPSATPSRNIIDLSGEPSQPSPSRPKLSKTHSDTLRNKKNLVPTSRNAQDTEEPHINLAHPAKAKGTCSPSKLSPELPLKSPAKTPKKMPTAQPYVLITPRQESTSHRPELNHPVASTSRSAETGDTVYGNDNPGANKLSKGKNKATESFSDAKRHGSGSQYSPSSAAQGKMRQQPRHDSISSGDESELPAESSPNKPPRFGMSKGKPNTSKGSPKGTKTSKGNLAKDHRASREASRQRQSDMPQSSPFKKRKRVSSDENSDLSDYAVPERKTESSPLKSGRASSRPSSSHAVTHTEPHPQKPKKRSSSSRRRHLSTESDSDGGYDSESSVYDSGGRYQRSKSHSGINAPIPPRHHAYHHIPYASSHYPPQEYQPLPDPRAQLIISQAMQQLSALVGAAWAPPHHYMDGSMPNTPHRHRDGRLPNGPFITPTHRPHPYPYIYDPSLSNATLPPESPQCDSLPSKSSSGRRKSLVGRSRSRGRRVSFNLYTDIRHRTEDEADGYSSPPGMRLSKNLSKNDPRGDKSDKKHGGQRHKRETTPGRRHELTDDGESDIEVERKRKGYTRGQTPGPSIDSGEGSSTRRQSSSKRH